MLETGGDGARVAVGSANPVKRRAVERALPGAAVEAIPVDSGVPEQPRGQEETAAGAVNRAHNAFDDGAYDYGVGIEGGVASLPVPERPSIDRASAPEEGPDDGELFLIMWAAATDGKHTGQGAGPCLALPPRIASRVEAGEELGPVIDDAFDEEGIARSSGAAGVLTAGRLTRADALADAVVAALAPFTAGGYW